MALVKLGFGSHIHIFLKLLEHANILKNNKTPDYIILLNYLFSLRLRMGIARDGHVVI